MIPWIQHPNAPNPDGQTPIACAALHGHTDIIKILAPLSINPNVPTNFGSGVNWTPIYCATIGGNIEVIKALIPWTDNPNAPNLDGRTPIAAAALHGHTDIIELLRPFAPYDCYAKAKCYEFLFSPFGFKMVSGLYVSIVGMMIAYRYIVKR